MRASKFHASGPHGHEACKPPCRFPDFAGPAPSVSCLGERSAMLPRFKAAAVHASPVFLDAAATTEKAVSLIREAARAGAALVAFPETFIPAFPVWARSRPRSTTTTCSPACARTRCASTGRRVSRIREAARAAAIVVSIGISERSPASLGCLWNSNLLIGEDGSLLNHHRKLVPTFYEKLVWAAGDGAGLRVVETAIGRIGQLICGENTNPLARYSLMAQGEQFHISSWPPVWPTRRPQGGGNYDIVAANRIRTAAHCFEAKVFGLATAGLLDRAAFDLLAAHDPAAAEVLEGTPRPASFFLDPTGAQIGEALLDEGDPLRRDRPRCLRRSPSSSTTSSAPTTVRRVRSHG